MIKEDTINRILDRLESGKEDYQQEIQDFAESQPYLVDYLTHEDTEAFSHAEQELLLFGALVIYQSVADQQFEPATVPSVAITEAEEKNYELVGEGKGVFRERITPLFEASGEEELLAFAEDMLTDDEGGNVSKEGREPLFITLKTVVDVLA